MNMDFNHNSATMNTIVETFVQEETKELIYDNEQLDRWRQLCKDNGLEGQLEVAEPTKSPIPFMYLKKGQVNIFEELCPRKDLVSKYNKTPIPLEIVELVALSVREEYFDKIEIWYDERSPDPVCLGMNQNWRIYSSDGYTHPSGKTIFTTAEKDEILKDRPGTKLYQNEVNTYLLGKWGDVKRSLEELKAMAIERFTADKRVRYEKEIKEAQRGLLDLDEQAHERFA